MRITSGEMHTLMQFGGLNVSPGGVRVVPYGGMSMCWEGSADRWGQSFGGRRCTSWWGRYVFHGLVGWVQGAMRQGGLQEAGAVVGVDDIPIFSIGVHRAFGERNRGEVRWG